MGSEADTKQVEIVVAVLKVRGKEFLEFIKVSLKHRS